MKQPIALLINDLHVNRDNVSEFCANWQEMLDLCKSRNIGDIVVGGDMFTSRSSQTLPVLLAVRKMLKKAVRNDVQVTLAAGNHDKIDTEDESSYVHLFADIPRVDVVDSHIVMTWDDVDFAFIVMSYFPENGSFLGRLESAVKEAKDDFPDFVKSRRDIILYIHEGVHGSLGNFEIEGELPQEPLRGFYSVLCSHYHNRIKIKGTNIEYIGSSRQHNFGEDEEKGYTILYSDGSTEFVKNRVNTRYKTLELDAASLPDKPLKKENNYKYRVKVNCDEKSAKLFNKQSFLEMGFDKVELVLKEEKHEKAEQSDIQEKFDKAGIQKEYCRYCEDNHIDNRLGMKYLEG